MSTVTIRTKTEENAYRQNSIKHEEEVQKMFEININDIATVNGGIRSDDYYLRGIKERIRKKRKAQEEQQKKDSVASECVEITQ